MSLAFPTPPRMGRRPAGVLLALLALCFLGASAVVAEQKYLLKESAAAGDVATVESTMEMSLDLKVTAPGQDPIPLKIANKEREKYTETVQEVTKDVPSVFQRAYAIARSFSVEPNGKPVQKTTSLQGKTVDIRIGDGKASITSAQGALAEEDLKSLTKEVQDRGPHFLPGRDTALQEEWSVDPALVKKSFSGTDQAEVKGRLEEVAQRDGHPCARIRLTMNLSGNMGDSPVPMTMKLSGDGWFALDTQRPLTLDLSGPLTVNGDTEQDGKQLHFDGSGSMKMTENIQWLKVAGKAVAR